LSLPAEFVGGCNGIRIFNSSSPANLALPPLILSWLLLGLLLLYFLIRDIIMSDPGASTSALLAALPALEASLGKLKEKPWTETAEGLDSLDRAKMDVLMSYAINDLIWGKLMPFPSHNPLHHFSRLHELG
jgi:hypothetical protein